MLQRVNVGSVVRVEAVDWCRHLYDIEPKSIEGEVTLKSAVLYGRVVKLNDELIALAPQVFEGGTCREVLAVPVVCVKDIEVLREGERSMSKLYYIAEKVPNVAYEVRTENSRADEAELIHLSPAAVNIACFEAEPVLVDTLVKGSIVRVA